eukprot:COSAG05_NODE_127_length_17241_cov_7.514817_11_plen_124_part_00
MRFTYILLRACMDDYIWGHAPVVAAAYDALRESTALPECTGTSPATVGHAAETKGVTVTDSNPGVRGWTPSTNLLRNGVAPADHGWQYLSPPEQHPFRNHARLIFTYNLSTSASSNSGNVRES